MRKRPLALLCLAVAIFLALHGAARGAKRDAALLAVQEYLAGAADTNSTLTFEGIVKEVNAVSEGTRLSIHQIRIVSDSLSGTSSETTSSDSTNTKPVTAKLSASISETFFSANVFTETAAQTSNATATLSDEIQLLVNVSSDDFLPGDFIRVSGKYRPLEEATNPGQFDSQEYYFAQNTVGWVTSASVTLISEGDAGLSRMLARFRRALRYSYLQILEEKAARTVSAISLGEKSYMEQEWKLLYQEGGISHIISISGLHISMIGMCIYHLLRRLRLPFAVAAVPSAITVALYALMSGFGVSAMRACIMFIIWLGAQIVGRKNDTLTATAIAAALILTGNSRAATGSSFLLSFGAILSIALLVPRLAAANPFRSRERKASAPANAADRKHGSANTNATDRKRPLAYANVHVWKHPGADASVNIRKHTETDTRGSECSEDQSCESRIHPLIQRLRPLLEKLWNALCGGAGVWFGTLPITLWFFYQCAPWSLLVNLAVIPLMSALMASGLISCLVGLISIPAGTFLAAPVYYLLGLFEGLCEVEQQLPGAIWIAGCPAVWKIFLYYALLICAAVASARIQRSGRNPDTQKKPRKTPSPHAHPFASRTKPFLQQPTQARTRQNLHLSKVKNRNGWRPANAKSKRNRHLGNAGTFKKQCLTNSGIPKEQHLVKAIVPACLWLSAFALGICLMAYHPRTTLTVISLDVGQGDGALIQLPDGTNCLIDGGSTSVSSLWQYRISQTLKYYGISRLDYVFLSHADSDHINGIQEYLDDYLPGFANSNAHGITLKHLVLPPTADETDFEELIESALNLGIPISRMEAGAQIGNSSAVARNIPSGSDVTSTTITNSDLSSLSNATIDSGAATKHSQTSTWSLTCLAPSSDALSGDSNEDSMVLLLQYGSFRMLFTGDLEGDSEKALALSGTDISCDVLKVGHHGSKGASCEEFLAAASPAFGIISCGKDNSYGHPAAAAVERLQAADITLYATMDCGAVTIRSDGVRYWISGYIKTEAYA